MTALRQQMIAALQLSGKGERTQQAYVREVRLLTQFYGKSPDLISEPELQAYFLHRKNVDHLAPNSMRICYSGIKFFYQSQLLCPGQGPLAHLPGGVQAGNEQGRGAGKNRPEGLAHRLECA
jgi:hypothetical protein